MLTTRVGLQLPDVLTFEEWERAGRQLAGVLDSSSWWLGDWLTYGKDHYSDRYQQGIQTAGLRYQTLRNYAWVARRFDVGRRRARLTFQHHAEVASLPVAEQDEWLSRAEELSWTTKQLRSALREARGGGGAKSENAAAVRQLAVPRDRFERWLKAAECSGADVDAWVLSTLDSAAELVIESAVESPAEGVVEGAVRGADEGTALAEPLAAAPVLARAEPDREAMPALG
ncbi:LmbU family transcriptional regulator [Streptomyces sporangiiformans]|uniref:LmbU family transcriptional regulator n=1 Tax=Streptomyces sporangiiformans TaxID=2315329 RepID=UPI0019691ED2|nr:LmbU family transcriptional regulator [Streptomyces sporangiiformans]